MKRILRMAGLPDDRDNENLEFLALRKYTPEQRIRIAAVSYTHLDVYKRQELVVAGGNLNRAGERRAVEIHAGERNVLHIDIVRAGFFERCV